MLVVCLFMKHLHEDPASSELCSSIGISFVITGAVLEAVASCFSSPQPLHIVERDLLDRSKLMSRSSN
jgi:hypothetical protein